MDEHVDLEGVNNADTPERVEKKEETDQTEISAFIKQLEETQRKAQILEKQRSKTFMPFSDSKQGRASPTK